MKKNVMWGFRNFPELVDEARPHRPYRTCSGLPHLIAEQEGAACMLWIFRIWRNPIDFAEAMDCL